MTDFQFAFPNLGGDPLCAETDPEAFFPKKGGTSRPAKAICANCDLLAACLQWAMEHDEAGVWGGLSEFERRRLKARRRREYRRLTGAGVNPETASVLASEQAS